MSPTLSEYRLICYTNTCSCGAVQEHQELHTITQSGNAFNETLTKPGDPIYAIGEIFHEPRTSRTRACLACIATTPRSELPEFTDPKKVVGRSQPKLKEIDISELDL